MVSVYVQPGHWSTPMGSFDADRFKAQLKLCKCRLENLLKQHRNTSGGRRKEIATFLQQGMEERARVNVKYLIRDDYLMEAYEMLLTCCDDLIQSTGLITREKMLDPDLMLPARSLVYASGRIEAPELDRIKQQLEAKYGKNIMDVSSEMGKASVDPSLVVKLSVRSPDIKLVNRYMAAIAQIFNVEWTPPTENIIDEAVVGAKNVPSMPAEYAPPPYSSDLAHITSHSQNLTDPPALSTPPAGLTSPHSSTSSVPDFDELARRFQALKDK